VIQPWFPGRAYQPPDGIRRHPAFFPDDFLASRMHATARHSGMRFIRLPNG
jgi:hypothetical protein